MSVGGGTPQTKMAAYSVMGGGYPPKRISILGLNWNSIGTLKSGDMRFEALET